MATMANEFELQIRTGAIKNTPLLLEKAINDIEGNAEIRGPRATEKGAANCTFGAQHSELFQHRPWSRASGRSKRKM